MVVGCQLHIESLISVSGTVGALRYYVNHVRVIVSLPECGAAYVIENCMKEAPCISLSSPIVLRTHFGVNPKFHFPDFNFSVLIPSAEVYLLDIISN
jgi:hypothetical protein